MEFKIIDFGVTWGHMRSFELAVLFAFTCLGMSEIKSSAIPRVGDRFLFHQETITTGTASFQDEPLEPLSQDFEVWGQALVSEIDGGHEVTLRFTFDRFVLRVSIGDQGSCELEVLPGKVILDGTAVYDRERNPDLPVGLLDLLINEEIGVKLDPQSSDTQIRQFRRNRSQRSYLDLLSVVRGSLIPAPPLGIEVEQSWVVVRPMEWLGGNIVLPATETYRYNQQPSETNPVRILQRTVEAHQRKPIGTPIRMGLLATENLRFDALGPNLTAPPPEMKILDFDYDAKEILEFDTVWGFTRKVGSISEIRMTAEVPPPDGIEMKKKELVLHRRTLLTVEKATDSEMTGEERELLLGNAAEPN